jgi:hypothetical protein
MHTEVHIFAIIKTRNVLFVVWLSCVGYSVIHKLLPSNVLEIYTFYFVYHPLYSFSSVTAFNINPVDKACSNWKLTVIHCRQFSIL